RETSVLGAFVVEEDDPRTSAAGIPEGLPLVDRSGRARAVREHHPVFAVRLDDVDPLDVDGVERRRLLARERRDRDAAERERRENGVALEKTDVAFEIGHREYPDVKGHFEPQWTQRTQ